MMPLLKVFVKRFVVLFHDYYISITTTGESEIVKISSAVARTSPGVRGKARYLSSGRLEAVAAGESFSQPLSFNRRSRP